jgi:hypothetical protein
VGKPVDHDNCTATCTHGLTHPISRTGIAAVFIAANSVLCSLRSATRVVGGQSVMTGQGRPGDAYAGSGAVGAVSAVVVDADGWSCACAVRVRRACSARRSA